MLLFVLPLVVLLIITSLTYNTIRENYIKSKLDAGAELDKALSNMEKTTDYKYDLISGFTVEEREEVISKVHGEKSDGKTHIKGEMVNTPVDIYYIDRTIYNYDSVSQKWLVIESDTSQSEELLISELNPMSNFRIEAPGTVEKIGFEKIDGTECLLVGCKNEAQSELLQTFWQNFEYKFWIDYKKGLVKKALLTAKNKESLETSLAITATFSDINKKISIEAPDTSKK